MPKDKISDYSATANSNTDIGGINIDEGCAPSGINDAIRTLMKQLKDWQSGSQDVYIHPAGSASVPSITATGDTNTGIFFPAADTVGISTGGTERARFDYSGNFGVGTTSPSVQLHVSKAGSTATRITNTSVGAYAELGRDATGGYVESSGAYPLQFYTNGSERARFNAGAPILCLSGGNTSATGTGIAFPATQSASSDANTLDDYEEGTWTPTISGLTNCTVTNKASATNRRYTKVGNVVTINIGFDYTSSGGVPSFSFTLPFAPQTDYGLSGFGFGYPNVIRWAVRSNSGVTINAYGDVASTSAADINISLSYQV